MTNREINVPFGGFYESKWSGLLDHEMEMLADYDCEKQSSAEYHPETYQPPELRVADGVFHSAAFDACDYSAAYRSIARDYVDAFNTLIEEETGLKLGLALKDMASPKFYNFETDRLFSDISLPVAKRLLAFSKKLDKHSTLRNLIRERHSSYDGFHSSYSNCSDEWMSKPIAEWDHNELCTLLHVVIAQLDDEWEWSLYETLSDGGREYLDSAMDWPKYERAIEDAREELKADLAKDDPDYVIPTPRCPDTLDLFRA